MTTDPRTPINEAFDQAEDVDMGDMPDREEFEQQDGAAETKGPKPADRAHEAALYPLNDIGNGKRFEAYFGDQALRVPRVAWHTWTKTHWARDDDDLKVREMAQLVSPEILNEIPHIALEEWEKRAIDALPAARDEVKRLEAIDDLNSEQAAELGKARFAVSRGETAKKALGGRRADHRRHSKATGNSGKIDAMLKEAAVNLSERLDSLDADPLAINCATGTVRFTVVDGRDPRTGKDTGASPTVTVRQAPHDRKDLITKCMPVNFDPDAAPPEGKKFDAFLRRVQPNEEMRRFIQRWFGLSMSGIPVQKLAFFYGHGANGKSVLVDLICRIMDDYAATAPIEALTGQSRRGGSDATPELIPLIGARAVRSSEPEQGERFKEGMIKSLTSGEPIPVRALHSDFVFIKTFFKLTISGNHKPEIRGTDDGIWRRVLLVPFDVQIPEAERDPNLGEALWAERDAVFAWMVEGLRDYLEGGLQVPAQVTDATDGYRKDSDPVGAFLAECTVMDGGDDFILSKDLIEAFNFWLEENGETRWGGRTVSLRLKDKAGRWRHPATGKAMVPGKQKATGYRGVRLTDTFNAVFSARHDGGHGYGERPRSEEDW